MKVFIESSIQKINEERLLFFQFKPGFVYPKRHFNVVKMPNKVHLFFLKFWPDYSHWMLESLLGNAKEVSKTV